MNRTKLKLILLLLGVFLLNQSVSAAGDRLTGQRLKVTGRWNGKYVAVDHIKKRSANKDPMTGRVEGQISAISYEKSGFVIGPIVVKMTKQTRFIGIAAKKLKKGVSVEAIGRLVRPGLLVAETIEPSSTTKGYVEILGAVTASQERSNGDVQARILGVPIRMPRDVFDRGLSLIRNPDDKRPDQQLTISLWNKPLTIGGEIGNRANFRGDYKLEDAAEDDVAKMEQGLQLEFFYRPSKNVAAFAEVKTDREQVIYDQKGEGGLESQIKRGEMWLYAGRLFNSGLALQIGRQNFRDTREWWWDDDLDAVRLYYLNRRISGEFAVAKELSTFHLDTETFDPEDQGVLRYFGRFSWALKRSHRLDFFYLRQNDRSGWNIPLDDPAFEPDDEQDARFSWQGLRLIGDLNIGIGGDFEYWIDAASLRGRESYFDEDVFQQTLASLQNDDGDDRRGRNRGKGGGDDDLAVNINPNPGVLERQVRAWAFDAGFSWETKWAFEPTLSLSYAVGSGGGADSLSRTFRQTGLHDNNWKYSGVDRFRYYGELFRPDLSNIRILTASAGFPFWRSSSIELVFHKYRQFRASTARNSRLKVKPNGVSLDLGEEYNLVLGLEKWTRLEVEIIGGLFRAGKAYGTEAGKNAYTAILKFDINF